MADFDTANPSGEQQDLQVASLPLSIPESVRRECNGSESLSGTVEEHETEVFGVEDAEDLGIKAAVLHWLTETKSQFSALDYSLLLPVKFLFSRSLFRKKAVRLVFYLGLLPLLVLQIHQLFKMPLRYALWAVILYFCSFWAAYFYTLLRPAKDAWKKAVGYAIFTAIAGVFLLGLIIQLPIARELYYGGGDWNPAAKVFVCIFGVGLIEEFIKALPLLIFGFRRRSIRTPQEGMLLGIMSGLAFALVEGVRYLIVGASSTVQKAVQEAVRYVVDAFGAGITAMFTHKNAQSDIEALARRSTEAITETVTEQALLSFFRIMSGPILHAAWAAILGWFIAVAAARQENRWPIVAVGLALVATLHGVYDACAKNLLGFLVAALSLGIFMTYLIREAAVMKQPPPSPPEVHFR